MALLTTEPGEFFHLCQSLLPGYSGMKWVSSRILFELSGSKAAANNHFSSIVGCCIVCGNYTRTANGASVLHSFIYWNVGEPTRHPCSTTGMLQDNHLLQLGVTWHIYSRELLCYREEVLSVIRIVFSESVVFYLVFWVSSFVPAYGYIKSHYSTVKATVPSPCAHILSSPEGQWEKMDKECPPQAKCCLKALDCPNVRGSCGLAALPEKEQRMSRGCLCDSSQVAKHPNI